MRKIFILTISCIISLTAILSFTSKTWAATTQLKVNIEGGILSLQNPNIATLSAISLEAPDNSSTGSIGDLEITDNRGTGSGWSVTATVSDFTCCNNQYRIPVSNLTIEPGLLTTVSGSGEGVTSGSNHNYTSVSDIATLLTANSGFGMGSYKISPILRLEIPKNIYTGEYSATLVITVI